MRIIVCNEKFGDYYYHANDEQELETNAMDILVKRYNQGLYLDYRESPNLVENKWYADAKRSIETDNPVMAWRLLQARCHHEYENVYLDNVSYDVV